MSDLAIRVHGIGKQYRLGELRTDYRTLKETLTAGARRAGSLLTSPRAGRKRRELFWALRGISFDVVQGDVIGIIGGNGAGKSTLLKILSRITQPTEGDAWIYGRVGSLLEVGTGFHPELTGRENTYLNGAILGMNRGEIDRKFDEIVDFAEVARFIDTPVKHYSSGMYLRLAFAVAAHLEPEILIVDEVLAVGDASFQRKCLGKMGDVAQQGRTVIFVSHNMDAVQRLCSRCLLLERGRVTQEGSPDDVIAKYLSRDRGWGGPGSAISLVDADRAGSGGVRFMAARYGGSDESVGGHPVTGGPFECSVEIESDSSRMVESLSLSIRTPGGTLLVNADVISLGRPVPLHRGPNTVRFHIDALHLNPGRYIVGLWVADASLIALDYIAEAFEIEVIPLRASGFGVTPKNNGAVPCRFDVTVDTPIRS